ncbi:MAG: DUF1501 domain-containing protein [Burkholderiaceae bacterium]
MTAFLFIHFPAAPGCSAPAPDSARMALHGLLQGAANPLAPRPPRTTGQGQACHLSLHGRRSLADGSLRSQAAHSEKRTASSVAAPLPEKDKHESTAKLLALGTEIPVRPRGQSGVTISDLLPHTAAIADELCLLRAVQADNNQHGPAALQFHTGVTAEARPSMGSWISYGLGTENQNLPGFLTIHPGIDTRLYGSLLPARRASGHARRPSGQGKRSRHRLPHRRHHGSAPRSGDALISSSA